MVIICSRIWTRGAWVYKFILKQLWCELVPRLQHLDQGRLMGSALWEIASLGDWVKPGSWGVELAGFGHGVQQRAVWYDPGYTGSLVECGIPCPWGAV